MKGYDLFELAVRNLRQSKLRNGLDHRRNFRRGGIARRDAVARRGLAATGDAASGRLGNVRHRVRDLQAGLPRLRPGRRSEDRASGKCSRAGRTGARQDDASCSTSPKSNPRFA